ncbi:MAG: four helix bundle protein [Saprospiraceae bacterium]|nr:four helix bundle protein [Saprospiraceae bacterium]
MGNFKSLRVWNEAMNLVEKIYTISKQQDFYPDDVLRRQITKAAISIPSNIAEGDERGTNKESIHFFNIAKGSTAEVITQVILASRLGYIDAATLVEVENLAEKIRAMLKNLIQARTKKIKI